MKGEEIRFLPGWIELVAAVFVVLTLTLSLTFPVWALSTAERKAVMQELDRKAKMHLDELEEFREERVLVEMKYSNPVKPDIFAFLTVGDPGDEINVIYYIFLLTNRGNGYKYVASSRVGNAFHGIEVGYVEVCRKDFLLRSASTEDMDNEYYYGTAKIYYRWRLKGSQLEQVGKKWIKMGGELVEAKKQEPE